MVEWNIKVGQNRFLPSLLKLIHSLCIRRWIGVIYAVDVVS
jgi:hypothetical protein